MEFVLPDRGQERAVLRALVFRDQRQAAGPRRGGDDSVGRVAGEAARELKREGRDLRVAIEHGKPRALRNLLQECFGRALHGDAAGIDQLRGFPERDGSDGDTVSRFDPRDHPRRRPGESFGLQGEQDERMRVEEDQRRLRPDLRAFRRRRTCWTFRAALSSSDSLSVSQASGGTAAPRMSPVIEPLPRSPPKMLSLGLGWCFATSSNLRSTGTSCATGLPRLVMTNVSRRSATRSTNSRHLALNSVAGTLLIAVLVVTWSDYTDRWLECQLWVDAAGS